MPTNERTSTNRSFERSFIVRFGAALSLVLALSLGLAVEAQAHCDSVDGPVVTDAREALKTGNLTPVLKWVRSRDEAEVRRVFEKTLEVRKKGSDAQELADRYFFETVVRLHRASEGAPYTGLKPADAEVPPSIKAADEAIKTGSAGALTQRITKEVKNGLQKRYERVLETKARADESVEAGRAYVKAYVTFIHYVERLHKDATSSVPQAKAGGAENTR
ncbi:MAG: DUF6448 family protein [Candidatus Bipolaricaulia bacterium]